MHLDRIRAGRGMPQARRPRDDRSLRFTHAYERSCHVTCVPAHARDETLSRHVWSLARFGFTVAGVRRSGGVARAYDLHGG